MISLLGYLVVPYIIGCLLQSIAIPLTIYLVLNCGILIRVVTVESFISNENFVFYYSMVTLLTTFSGYLSMTILKNMESVKLNNVVDNLHITTTVNTKTRYKHLLRRWCKLLIILSVICTSFIPFEVFPTYTYSVLLTIVLFFIATLTIPLLFIPYKCFVQKKTDEIITNPEENENFEIITIKNTFGLFGSLLFESAYPSSKHLFIVWCVNGGVSFAIVLLFSILQSYFEQTTIAISISSILFFILSFLHIFTFIKNFKK